MKNEGPRCNVIGAYGPKVGNPINAATGNKYQEELDYQGTGPFPLEFRRIYNAAPPKFMVYQRAIEGLAPDMAPNGVITTTLTEVALTLPAVEPSKVNWHHGYQRQILLLSNGSGYSAMVSRHDGNAYIFVLNNGVWKPDADVTDKLVRLYDASGVPTGWEYTNNNDEVERYDTIGRLISITNRAGFVQTLSYNAQGQLSAVTDPFGRQLIFTYDTEGRMATMADMGNGIYLYAYDAQGNVASITYPDNQARTYVYEDSRFPRALTGIIDANGQRYATWTYDDQGRAVSSQHGVGADATTIVYNGDGTAIVTDALGTSRTYTFATSVGVAKLANVTEPCSSCGGSSASVAYDANGNVASRTDFNGTTTTYTYDLARNLETFRTEAYGTAQARTIATEWHPTFRLPTRITEPSRITTYTYDPSGNLTQKTISSGTLSRTWTYTYTTTADGTLPNLLKTINGPRTDGADITTYAYDAQGNLSTVTNALGQITRITSYDAHGHPLTLQDPNGLVTTLTYDPRGRVTGRSAGGETTTYAYDGVGQLTRVTLPGGSTVDYTYDDAHRLTAITDALGNRITYTLDLMGNRIQEDVTDPLGALARTHARYYNALNRLVQELGATGQTATYYYDDNGNLTTATDPLNHSTTNAYDALNRLIQVTDPNNGVTQYTYDANDRLTRVTDPRSLQTNYTYDGLDNLGQTTSPDTGATVNTYDTAGNLKTATDARGQTATYTYDALNRVTAITYSTPNNNITYQYDSGPNALGRLSKMTDETGNTQWTYDAQGRVTRKTQQTSTLVLTLAYAYDSAGRLSQITYPSGKMVSYTYNTLDQVSALAVDGQPLLSAIQYAPYGGVTGWTWANGSPYTRSRDTDGRIASYTLGSATRTVSYDAASRLTALTDPANAANNITYGYDTLDRLTGATTGTTNYNYSYDPDGNRLTQTVGASAYNYTYGASDNRLTSTTGPTARSYTYDTAGNLTADGTNTYTYSPRGRLSAVTYGTGSNTYLLNGLGQRLIKNGTGGSVRYTYDESGHLIGEYATTGVPANETVYLGDTPVAVLTPKETLVDNTTTAKVTLVGTWPTATTVPGYYGSNYHTHAPGSGANTFTWKPAATAAGGYRLYARWSAAADRATNATYTLTHASGTTAISVNQQQNGGQWNYLGTYTYNTNQIAQVTLTDLADGTVIADAVKLVPVNAATVYTISTDHLDTPRVITDPANKIIWRWDADPFGATPANEDPDGDTKKFTYNLRFPGQVFDKETGLYYNYYRDYDPGTGRYVESDPIGLRGGINTYTYVSSNPLRFIDPEGLLETDPPIDPSNPQLDPKNPPRPKPPGGIPQKPVPETPRPAPPKPGEKKVFCQKLFERCVAFCRSPACPSQALVKGGCIAGCFSAAIICNLIH